MADQGAFILETLSRFIEKGQPPHTDICNKPR